MAMNICQAFLKHAEQHKLAAAGKACKVVRYPKIQVNATTLRKSTDEPSCGRSNANLMQRRMQQVARRAYFPQGLIGKGVQILQGRDQSADFVSENSRQRHFDGRQSCPPRLDGLT